MTRNLKPYKFLMILPLSFSNPSSSQPMNTSPKIVLNRSIETQYSGIGELESNVIYLNSDNNEVRKYGTGVLISPCYIITNHHVADGHDADPIPGEDYSMKFRVGSASSAAFRGNTIATPVIWGNLGVAGSNDWVILKLRTCVGAHGMPGRAFGWYESADLPVEFLLGQHVAALGFAGDTERGELSFGEGIIRGYDKNINTVLYDAPIVPGESGGPVFIIIKGVMKLVGLNTITIKKPENGKIYGLGIADFAVDVAHRAAFTPINEVLRRTDIQIMLDKDKALHGNINDALLTPCFLRSQQSCQNFVLPSDPALKHDICTSNRRYGYVPFINYHTPLDEWCAEPPIMARTH